MSRAAALSERYATRLREADPSLPVAFGDALRAVEGGLGPKELERWARAVADLAADLADRSPEMAAAFLGAAPGVLAHAGPGARDHLDRWVAPGRRMWTGTRKSGVLAARWFRNGPALLESLPFPTLDRVAEVVERIAEHSPDHAATFLAQAVPTLAALAEAEREPFLALVGELASRSWPDALLAVEEGPRLLGSVDPGQRVPLLDLARCVAAEGRGGRRLTDVAAALGGLEPADQAELVEFAGLLARRSPAAAMEYLASAPAVRSRLGPEQFRRWSEVGRDVLQDEGSAEGAEAYFRLESTRSTETLAALSARVELAQVAGVLRLYAQALTGTPLVVRSTEAFVGPGSGRRAPGDATTADRTIFLPPFVDRHDDRGSNFQVYKVSATHQAGRFEFGSFGYRFGADGAHLPSTVAERGERAAGPRAPASTPIRRFFDLFSDRALIAGLFALVEDTRVDAHVAVEYGGVRAWLRRVQDDEAERRPDVGAMGLRQALVENLLRFSLGRPDTIRWPASWAAALEAALEALPVVQAPDATVQDSAEVAALIYDLAVAIPNLAPVRAGGEWSPTGGEIPYESPPSPEFRGDLEPETVQTYGALRDREADADVPQLTRQQIRDVLEHPVEIVTDDGEVSASSLDTLIDDILRAASEESDEETEGPPADGTPAEDGDEGEEPVGIEWSSYDEWDFRAGDYRPGWCRVGERLAEAGGLEYYEETLRRHHGLVLETRRQFELVRPESFRRLKRLEDGHEIDLDRAIEFHADKRAGAGPLARFYSRRDKIERDVAVAFLLDMSQSTDEPIGQPAGDDDSEGGEPSKRVIDVEKESTVLVVEALESIGDAYGIYGFSGYGRHNVEFHVIKNLHEGLDDRVRRRIARIEPRRSTRMGPAIRHAAAKLRDFDAKVKILLLVSDGRPEDHGYGRDHTDHDYAVHDTRQALLEARREGVVPFLITVDREGHDYLRQMCGDLGYEVVADIEALPRRLPALYRHLAGG